MQAPFADPLTGIELHVQQLPLFGRESEVRAIRSVLDSVTEDRPVGPREAGQTSIRLLRWISAMSRRRYASTSRPTWHGFTRSAT